MSFRRRLQDLLGLHQTANSYNNEPYKEPDPYVESEESLGLDYDDELPYRPERENNVIAMPGLSSFHSELVVMEPAAFQEVPAALVALRDRKVVVLNLSQMEGGEAQRAVDYVAGGTFALNGHQERIGKNVFLFTPHSVQITSQAAQEMVAGHQFHAYPPPSESLPQDQSVGAPGASVMNPMTQEQEMLRKLELRAGKTPPPPPPRPRSRF